MPYIFILYLFVFSLGFLVYLRMPQMFFVYWLSVPAFIIPLFFFLFRPSYIGEQTFDTFYWGYLTPMSYLLIVISYLEYVKYREFSLYNLLKPLIVFAFFFVIQNILTGFSLSPLVCNFREILFLMMPTVILSMSPTLRPDRKVIIHFIFLFIIIQTFFCIINTLGFSLS